MKRRETAMKTNLKLSILFFALLGAAPLGHAQTTAFTYHGRLNNNGVPVNDKYDVQFTLFDVPVGGTALTPPPNQQNPKPNPQVINGVGVTNGLFTVRLDYGDGIFTGPERWMEIAVKPTASAEAPTTIRDRVELTSSPYSIRSLEAATGSGSPWLVSDNSVYYNNGNVGIGRSDPRSKLHIAGAHDALRISGPNPIVTLYDTANSDKRSLIWGVNGELIFGTENFMTGSDPRSFLVLRDTGNVGIGKTDPSAKLEVASFNGDIFHLLGPGPFLTFYDTDHGYARNSIQSVDGSLAFFTDTYLRNPNSFAFLRLDNSGNVGIGTATPQAKLEVVGTTRTCVLAITGGCDLAEPFPMGEETIEKGSVVVIDDEHPGRLTRSTRAYDKRVAGIVSGANGVNSGIALQQEGVLDQGQNVALTGRVYVRADASYGAIKPGDLLTTSDTPGHAMKVTDYAKAQGAVLGKAMSALAQGKGMVLVLVTLQ